MSLESRISEDLKSAMKEKNQLMLDVLRQFKSQVKYFQIEKKIETLTDDDSITVLKKMIKQRHDSIQQYSDAKRNDLAEKEKMENAILMKYLPEQMSPEELKGVVEAVIKENGFSEKKQMGQAIKLVMAKTAGRADGKEIQMMIASILK